MIMINDIDRIISKKRFHGHNEKALQSSIAECLRKEAIPFNAEHRLDDNNIVDFMFKGGIAMEVKIKGNKRAIYDQLERYSRFPEVEKIILITSQSIVLPLSINQKQVHIINLNKAWI